MRVSKLMQFISNAIDPEAVEDNIYAHVITPATRQQTTTMTIVSYPNFSVDIDLDKLSTYVQQQKQLRAYLDMVMYWTDMLEGEDSEELDTFKDWMLTYSPKYLDTIAGYNEIDEPFFKMVKGYTGFLETYKYKKGAEDPQQVANDLMATIRSLYAQIQSKE